MQEQLIKVRANESVYRDERYYRAGDVLQVSESDVDAVVQGRKLFERVDPSTPEKITSSGEALAQERADTLASRAQAGQAADIDATGNADVLGGGAAAGDNKKK